MTDAKPIDTVRRLMEERGIGILEAKRLYQRDNLIRRIEAATTVDDLKAILLEMAGAPTKETP